MISTMASAPIALLFLALAIQCNAQTVTEAAEGESVSLRCGVRAEAAAEWSVQGPGGVRRAVSPRWSASETRDAAGGVVAVLSAPRLTADMAGLYRCTPRDTPHVTLRVIPAVSVVYYDVGRNLSLHCGGEGDAANEPVQWFKNETLLEEHADVKSHTQRSEDGLTLSVVGRSTEDDYGNYSCKVGGRERRFEVRGRTTAHMPPNTNVVEGQPLRLVCQLKGKPYPAVTWQYSNSSETYVDVETAWAGRVDLSASEQGVDGAVLKMEDVRRSDAGMVRCRPADELATAAGTQLRVKDKYAALWPFLGICAEVFVLCAVILIYERRRTKPDMDDSDTDHDQKKS